MTPLAGILDQYRTVALTEREKGTYFEELIRTYFRYEASFADLYDTPLTRTICRFALIPTLGGAIRDRWQEPAVSASP